jgi:hypothetical protein
LERSFGQSHPTFFSYGFVTNEAYTEGQKDQHPDEKSGELLDDLAQASDLAQH